MGFALLARHFEKSHVPVILPKYLPDDWKGAFLLLVMVWFISSFLDNIAAALIGGAMAHQLFKGKVHVGYLAGIVAASNAGGSFSVVGDTTTTMMWIAGVQPGQVFEAIIASTVALAHQRRTSPPSSSMRYSPILEERPRSTRRSTGRASASCCSYSLFAIITNVLMNTRFPDVANNFPSIGVAVWVAILSHVGIRRPDWEILPENLKGTIFLLSLVTMRLDDAGRGTAAASWQTALGLGFVSAVFDNIPLTALALKQGGYDWGFLAYAVGFGGSMIWFGSSAGVALSNMFPEAKSVGNWLRHGWHVALAYVVGFS